MENPDLHLDMSADTPFQPSSSVHVSLTMQVTLYASWFLALCLLPMRGVTAVAALVR